MSHWFVLPFGHGDLGTGDAVLSTLRTPVFAVTALSAWALLGSLPAALARLIPGLDQARGYARRVGLRPLAFGLALPLLSPLLDPLFFRCTAPALLALGGGLGILGAAWRLRALCGDSDRDRAPLAAAVAALCALALVPAWPGAQGDEPHYLVAAHSIWADGDLNLANDYGNAVYRGYHPAPLSPHYKPGLAEGSRYSMHGVGYPAVLAPLAAVGAAFGANGAVVVPRLAQALLYGAFAWLLLRLIEGIVGAGVALPGTLAAVALSPALFAPLHLFPETLAMTLACGAFLQLAVHPGGRRDWLAGLCLAALPWLGVKLLPLALVLGVVAPWVGRRARPSRWIAALAPLAGTLCLHALFTWSLYGSVSPSAIYLGSDPAFGRQPGMGDDWIAYLADWPGMLRTAVGYFVDQKEGLVAVGPQFLLAAAGLPLLWRRRPRFVIAAALLLAAYLGPYALSQQIGGQSPPARPLMAVLWLLAVPMAVGIGLPARGWLGLVRGVVLTLGVALTAVFAADPTLLPHDYPVTASWLLQSLSPLGQRLWEWFPHLLNVRAQPAWAVAVAWTLGIGLVCLLLGWQGAREAPANARASLWSWGASAYTVVLVSVLMLAAARVVVSDRHHGAPIADGVTAWVRYALPERAWAEPGGVWVAPGSPQEVILTVEGPLPDVDFLLRTLVDGDVRVDYEGRRTRAEIPAATSLRLERPVAAGWPWRGGQAYRVALRAGSGASPAEVEGGQDHRRLGAFLRLVPRQPRP